MISLIDANILIDAGKARLIPKLVEASGACPWRLTREVFDELESVPDRAKLHPLILASPNVSSAEAKTSTDLVTGGPWGTLGVGEASSIAAAFHDPTLEFVTWDIKAAWRSLHELRGRTSVGHDWLQHLVDEGQLDRADVDKIARADKTRRHPRWW